MFIPIGGIFVFGGSNQARMSAIIFNIFNLIMGALALLFGYLYGIVFLQVIGYIFGILALLTIFFNIIALRTTKGKNKMGMQPTINQ